MKRIAIIKARKRLNEARSYLDGLKQAIPTDAEQLHHNWSHFLTAIHAVMEILITSTKKEARPRQIVGQAKAAIRADKMLTYLREARGSDYHGGDFTAVLGDEDFHVVGHAPGSIKIKTPDGRTITQQMTFPIFAGDRQIKVGDKWGNTFKLITVVNEKHNTTFPVPTTHLGKPIVDPTPAGMGELAFEFYRALLDDVERIA